MAYAGQQQIRTQTPPMFANLAYTVSRSGTTVTYSLGIGIWTSDSTGWRNNRIACEFIVNGTSLGANRTVKNQTSGAIGTTPYWPTVDSSGESSLYTASLDNPYYLYSNRTLTLDGGTESFTVAVTIKETGYGTGMDGTYSWNTPSTDYGTFYWTISVGKATYWNDINAYYPDRSTQGALKFNLSTSDGSNWSSLTNEPDGFTKAHGTTATISGITNAVTGLHYTGNNVTNSTAASFSWTFNTANWVCELYSAWNTYTIKYDANGGSGSMSDTGATYGTAVTLRSNTFTRTHYTFKNWNTKADGSGTSYSDGASVSNLTSTNGGTVTLYAQWTGVTYTVSYNANGGTSTPTSQSVVYPSSVTLASAISKSNTSEAGYTVTYNANGGSGAPSSHTSGNRTVTWSFKAWAAGSTSGSQYSAGVSYQPSSNITMYAIWNSSTSANSSWTCSSTTPTRTGHTFLGWSTSSTATTATYAAGTTYTITGALTLYAVWQKNNYYLDVNGWLDGVAESNLGSYGTVDVTVAGVQVGSDVSDYYTQHPYDSSYSITDIKANSGYQYNGVYAGSLTGTIGAATTSVRLNFSTTKPSDVVIGGNWTSPFNIDLQWSATGLNVTYQLYIIGPDGSAYVQDCGTSLSTSVTTAEESTYQFYIAATNAGGTTNSSTITITTPADQAKIRRKIDGQWQKGKTYYKDEGTWKKVKKIYKKENGVWCIGTNYDS